MNKEENINKSLEEYYNNEVAGILKVRSIFSNFFGEEFVDLQGLPSLEEFINYFRVIQLHVYINISDTYYGDDEWDTYRTLSLYELDEANANYIIKIMHESERVTYNLKENFFRSSFILVYFPKVTVTNEYDKSIDIYKLFAKIRLESDGALYSGFTLNKAGYTKAQMLSGYLHSHCPSLNTYSADCRFDVFTSPCTGTGPINGTMASLEREFDEDLWNLFCLELSKYVTVESLTGGPYRKLEEVGSTFNSNSTICNFVVVERCIYSYPSYIKDFIKHFISLKKLKFNFINGSYSLGMTVIDYMVLISNEFIKWFNTKFNNKEISDTFDNLIKDHLLFECIISEGKIFYSDEDRNYAIMLEHIGKPVCKFKGNPVKVEIIDLKDEDDNKSILLNYKIAMYILNNILKIVNYRYGRENCRQEGTQLGTNVKYI